MTSTNIHNFKFRASSIGLLMAPPKSIDEKHLTPELRTIFAKKTKTDDEKALQASLLEKSLSAGAKTYIEGIAKEYCYSFHEVISGKYMDKGNIVEDESIALYNRVHFTNYRKNKLRKENEWITGECDIADLLAALRKIIDIKSAWNLATFPATAAAAHDSLYEWQGRAYMWLWDAELFELAFCLVDTPEELITRFEQEDLHRVSHIPEELRVTIVQYKRDLALEEKMKVKVEAARAYLAEQVHAIQSQHQQLEEAA